MSDIHVSSPNLIRTRDTSIASKRLAKEEFSGLLNRVGQPNFPLERDWQRFFERHPFVFTDSLPVAFDSLYSEVRLNTGRVDFLFHRNAEPSLFSTTGLIEIKRPDQCILDIYGSHMTLARNSNRGAAQLKNYLGSVSQGKLVTQRSTLALGNGRVAFLVIGMTNEITAKCHSEVLQNSFQGLLPSGVQLLTYDHIFRMFSSGLPEQVQVLVVGEPPIERILVVDDNPAEVMWLMDFLATRGYQVDLATTEQSARERLEAVKRGDVSYAMAVIDMMVATHDLMELVNLEEDFLHSSRDSGLRLCQFVRNDLGLTENELPIVCISARQDETEEWERLNPGGAFFSKSAGTSIKKFLEANLANRDDGV